MSQIMSDNKVSAWCPQSTLHHRHQCGGGDTAALPTTVLWLGYSLQKILSWTYCVWKLNSLLPNSEQCWALAPKLINCQYTAPCCLQPPSVILCLNRDRDYVCTLASIHSKILWENFKLGGGWVKYSNWTQYSNKQISSRGGLGRVVVVRQRL